MIGRMIRVRTQGVIGITRTVIPAMNPYNDDTKEGKKSLQVAGDTISKNSAFCGFKRASLKYRWVKNAMTSDSTPIPINQNPNRSGVDASITANCNIPTIKGSAVSDRDGVQTKRMSRPTKVIQTTTSMRRVVNDCNQPVITVAEKWSKDVFSIDADQSMSSAMAWTILIKVRRTAGNCNEARF